MTIVEQRRHPRHPLRQQPVGEFRLLTPDGAFLIKVINDISSAGIRFYSEVSLAPRQPVTVEYFEPSLKLEVNGTVAWCAEHSHPTLDGADRGRYIIGVELLSPMLLMVMSGTY